ncbi:MAG: bifunctional pyr operon transcriptional regulator/uracil phosphoribosyltransferase PyrR [Actinomycetales bacterium]|nr:bifunctional pyr operon transcriptional regulator/uracil phosphoribosyltransferase PyrR [Actinomycetales bacterium]
MRRMAHEVIERNADESEIVVLGLQVGGVVLAERLAADIAAIGALAVQVGRLDVAYFRDDHDRRPLLGATATTIPVDLTDRTVLLVDDVLYTGRTIRAALNALAEWGRPRAIQLAVLVDRGHRELPIRADFVGKNLPTAQHEAIVATVDGVWIGEEAGS